MPYWNQSARYKALNEKRPSKKKMNETFNAFLVMRQKVCEHDYRDCVCVKCGLKIQHKDGGDEVPKV